MKDLVQNPLEYQIEPSNIACKSNEKLQVPAECSHITIKTSGAEIITLMKVLLQQKNAEQT